MLLALLTLFAAPVMIRGPVLVGVTPDSAWIVWQTSEHQTNGTVRLGTSAGVYTANVQDTHYAEERSTTSSSRACSLEPPTTTPSTPIRPRRTRPSPPRRPGP
jgi:hypothetical protein